MFQSVSVAAKGQVNALLLGVFQPESGSPKLDRRSQEHDADGSIAAAVARAECTGEVGRLCEAFPVGARPAPRVIVVGLGPQEKFTAATLRNVAAAAGRRMAATKEQALAVDLAGPLRQARVSAAKAGQCFGEGMGILSFNTDHFRGSGGTTPKRTKLALICPEDEFRAGVERGLWLAESTNISRTCSVTPPNIATPEWMADQAVRLARRVKGLTTTVIKGDALLRERLIGLHTVGQASENKPCMIRIEWTPPGGGRARGKKRGRGAGGRTAKKAVLIGKTMTYDTGGLSLKINNMMRGMKADKDGGCAVLGAMHAIATVIKPDMPVVALLAAAENSISDEAYRPDDIITYRNGVTVEVTNTDAEGRLVLADALCWAKDRENPAFIVDVATLTGGVVVALGSTYAGMWCEDDGLRSRVEKAAEASGERVWRLPHHQEYNDMMKSSIADIINSNPARKAHPIQGAAFLSYFVDEKTPWCHLDIAGVHESESDNGPFAKEKPTGFGVRLLAGLFEGR